jgi:hypothetical protein
MSGDIMRIMILGLIDPLACGKNASFLNLVYFEYVWKYYEDYDFGSDRSYGMLKRYGAWGNNSTENHYLK